MDYCSTLYMGQQGKQQVVQNTVAWTNICTPGSAHITPLFSELHWLPVYFWVQFRMRIMTYKSEHSMESGYLRGYLSPVTYAHPIRTVIKCILWVLATKKCLLTDSIMLQHPPFRISSPLKLNWL